jgi:hypothetical protein
MPLYRDSENSFSGPITNAATGAVVDISSYEFRLELSQKENFACESLTMGDGLSFGSDGTDGILNITISKARINKFCTGMVRLRMFDDSGDDPVLVGEGSESVEGKGFDA